MDEGTGRYRPSVDGSSVLRFLRRWYHVPGLVVAVGFMFWVRAQSYENFVYDDGAVRLSAVDSWYHWRTTMYTVRNWPATMPYDPWTAYPTGTYSGQFGTLFDRIVATVALAVGQGSPTEQKVFTVALLAVPAIAALAAVPVYYVGRRLGGRVGGLAGAALLALFPGRFLTKTTAGMFQHHAAEVVFMSVAVLATMVALRAAEDDQPSVRHLVDREFGPLARPAAYGVLAGVAIALYIWVWPPGVLLVGILGCFFAVQLSLGYVHGDDPEHVAVVGVLALSVTGVLTAATMEVSDIHPTALGPLQPSLAFAVAAGCAFMVALTRAWDDHGIDARYYPPAVGGVAAVSLAAIALFLPGLWETLLRSVYGRLVPMGYSSTALTVPEARPPDDLARYFFESYGVAFYAAIGGLAALAARSFVTDDAGAERGFVVVWALILTSMAFTQVRFHYYYVVPVAVLNAYVVGQILEGVGLSRVALGRTRVLGAGAGRLLLFVAVMALLVAPLLPPIASATVAEVGDDESPGRDAMRWKSSNEWLAQHSPAPGEWGGADNADRIEYYGTYQVPEDGDFAYPEGAYGVMSWWHYGHLVTVQAERIPHSNPFQDNGPSAAAFFTAGSEKRGELVLEATAAAGNDSDLNQLDDDELAAVAAERTPQQETEAIRYVMIDDEMVGGKFDSMATYAGDAPDEYWNDSEVDVVESESTVNGTVTAPTRNEAYRDTVISRLYDRDADGMAHYRLVHDDNQQTQIASLAVSRNGGENWEPKFIHRPVTPGFVETLTSLRDDPDVDVAVYNVRTERAVKVFERVPGAELSGRVDVPAGTTVTAELTLTSTRVDRRFTYTQTATVGEDGGFSMTVPYPTESDVSVEDGYTESDVVATRPYVVTVDGQPVGTASVEESTVYAGGEGDLASNVIAAGWPPNASSGSRNAQSSGSAVVVP